MKRWKRTVDIKDFIDPSQTADVVALRIRGKLIGAFGSPDFELADIIADLENVGTVEECDDVLEHLYNWADAHDVWLGIKTSS